jgi:hypothetical protein
VLPFWDFSIFSRSIQGGTALGGTGLSLRSQSSDRR